MVNNVQGLSTLQLVMGGYRPVVISQGQIV